MTYRVQNGIHIVEIPVKDFRIEMCDAKKKGAAKQNYCNAGFFSTHHENLSAFTLPVAHLVCDYGATNKYNRKYCEERGDFDGNKFRFDSSQWSYMNDFCGHDVTTLLVAGNYAYCADVRALPDAIDYAISGVPIMRHGADVKYDPYVIGQGWDSSPVRATWHTFVGVNASGDTIYVMGMKTTTSNMIRTAEAFKKFKNFGLYDVIKLDGGGSFYFNVNGKTVASTAENRLINTIIHFGKTDVNGSHSAGTANPYAQPKCTLKQWGANKEGNLWLQWQLTFAGYACDIDGCFGPGTLKQVKAFQEDHGLEVDGKVGPATRTTLLNAARG